ncbi:MAG: hypothetical protein IJ905_09160 [Fibrobacter sp.]|nr:hypothetical protein [Fibrobacter sp.]
MLVTFLIVLGILALFGAGDAGDACAITLLLKVLPFLIFVGIVMSLAFCGGRFSSNPFCSIITRSKRLFFRKFRHFGV